MKKSWMLLLIACSLFPSTASAATIEVRPGAKIGDAIAEARLVYQQSGEGSTIVVYPGDYEEELTIDVPNLRLVNALCAEPDGELLAVSDCGRAIGPKSVRISWYYGHGYQYRSMGSRFNYGGKRERRWNASTLVTAPGFYAEGIIFQNSFNLYVSAAEAADSLMDITDCAEWKPTERPRRMPVRPKTVGSLEVQTRLYRERASALSFTETASDAEIRRCRVIGGQDALYGDHGASVRFADCVLQGGVDYIFGGMAATITGCELIAQVANEKGDRCYIAAGRGAVCSRVEELRRAHPDWKAACDSIPEDEYAAGGLRFVDCTVRYADIREISNPVDPADSAQTSTHPIWLARPWRWWGVHEFVRVTAAPGVLTTDPAQDFEKTISLGLTKGHAAPFCFYEK